MSTEQLEPVWTGPGRTIWPVETVADWYGVTPQSVRAWIRQGKLTRHHHGSRGLFVLALPPERITPNP